MSTESRESTMASCALPQGSPGGILSVLYLTLSQPTFLSRTWVKISQISVHTRLEATANTDARWQLHGERWIACRWVLCLELRSPLTARPPTHINTTGSPHWLKCLGPPDLKGEFQWKPILTGQKDGLKWLLSSQGVFLHGTFLVITMIRDGY